MSSNITLSAATRQNLLSLQDTASLLSTTQNRLSTGKKVNSALDNPTNFFTAQSLSSRSSDLSGLLDGMSNGVQVIQAANQGITSIQKLIDTAKSTAQQALADKTGGTSATISGGHTALAASVSGTGAYAAGSTDGTLDFSSLAKDGSLDISLDGGTTKTTLRLDSSTLGSATSDLTKVTKDQLISAINAQISASPNLKDKLSATSTPDGRITFTTTQTGAAAKLQVSGSANSSLDIGFGAGAGVTAATLTGASLGGNTVNMSATGAVIKLSVNDGKKNVDISIDKDTAINGIGTKVGNGAAVTSDVIVAAINKQLSDAGSTLTASFTAGNQLQFTSQDKGPDATISVTGGTGTVNVGFTTLGGNGTRVTATGSATGSVTGTASGMGATVDLSGTNSIRFTVNDGTAGNHTANIVVDQNTVVGGQAIGANATQANVIAAIQAQLDAANVNVTASNAGYAAGPPVTPGTFTLTNKTATTANNDVIVSNNLSSVDIGLGRAAPASAFTRGGGTAATGQSSSGADATDGSSKASVAGGVVASTVDFSTAGTDASFTLKLGDGPTKLISLTQSTVGSASSTSQATIAKAINDQIDADTGLKGKVQASFVDNKLVLTTTASGSDQKLTVKAAQSASSTIKDIGFGSSASGATAVSGSGTDVGGSKGVSNVRTTLAAQFTQILQSISQQAQDSSYNGINLLYRSSNNPSDNTLHISFNEKNSSALDISGVRFDAAGLGLTGPTGNFQSDDEINQAISQLTSATSTLRTQSSTFGANLSVVQNRQDFTKQLNNILDTGAANLTSADLNEEAANSQALSTRNSLAISALSLANQAQQGILQLLR